MRVTVRPDMNTRLLSIDDPLSQIGSAVTWSTVEGDQVAELVAGAFQGSVADARRLAEHYAVTFGDLASALHASRSVAVSRAKLHSFLFRLPYLQQAYERPDAALVSCALVQLREAEGRPIAAPQAADPDESAFVRFEMAISGSLTTDSVVFNVKNALKVRNEDVGRWTGCSAQSVSNWERGATNPRRLAASRLHSLNSLSMALCDVLPIEEIPRLFANQPVPLLAGRSYKDALDAGVDIDILVDVVRLAQGLEPGSEAGINYLRGPDAEGLAALAVVDAALPAGR